MFGGCAGYRLGSAMPRPPVLYPGPLVTLYPVSGLLVGCSCSPGLGEEVLMWSDAVSGWDVAGPGGGVGLLGQGDSIGADAQQHVRGGRPCWRGFPHPGRERDGES